MARVTVTSETAARLKLEAIEHDMIEDEYVRALLDFRTWAEGQAPYHQLAPNGLPRVALRRALEERGLAPDHD
jgi:hypothetical protein